MEDTRPKWTFLSKYSRTKHCWHTQRSVQKTLENIVHVIHFFLILRAFMAIERDGWAEEEGGEWRLTQIKEPTGRQKLHWQSNLQSLSNIELRWPRFSISNIYYLLVLKSRFREPCKIVSGPVLNSHNGIEQKTKKYYIIIIIKYHIIIRITQCYYFLLLGILTAANLVYTDSWRHCCLMCWWFIHSYHKLSCASL